MYKKKKKEVNYSATVLSLFVGAVAGGAYALLSTKKTGDELKKDIRKKTTKALENSKKEFGKQFSRAKKELSNEFETKLTKSVSEIKGKSKDLFCKVKALVG